MASSHSSRRYSRWLLMLLVVAIAAGAAFYLNTIHHQLRVAEAKLARADASRALGAQSQGPVQPALANPTASHALLPRESTPVAPKAAAPTPSGLAASTSAPAAAPAPAPAVTPVARGAAEKLLTDAKAKTGTGDLLGARALLNAPLVGGALSGTDADAVRAYLMQLNQTLIFSPQRFNDPYFDILPIQSSRSLPALSRQHMVPWEGVCRINHTSDRRIRAGQTLKFPKGPFNAVIYKSVFRMDLYLGGLPGESNALYVASLPVALGKDDSTPTGMWTVQSGSKGKNLDWTNPRNNEHFRGTDPKNPLGGYWIGLHGEGGNAANKTSYGIHGTIDPDSIGKQASMGCIRLRHDDIDLVYDLLYEGKSRVLVKD